MSLQAQKEGFNKLATASEYANLIEGGLATSTEKLKQQPEKLARFVRAALTAASRFPTKKFNPFRYMMEASKMTDRELADAIYDAQTRLVLRQGFSDDKVLQSMIDSMKKTTKVQREIEVADIFELSFVKKANEELKAAAWKP